MRIFDKKFKHDVQQVAADLSLILSKICLYGAVAGGVVMAIFGALSVEIAVIAAMLKAAERGHHNGDGPSFITMWLVMNMFHKERHCCCHGHCHHSNVNFTTLLVAAPLLSVVGGVVAVVLGVPEITACLIAGWGIVAGLAILGAAFDALGDLLKPGPFIPDAQDYETNAGQETPAYGYTG